MSAAEGGAVGIRENSGGGRRKLHHGLTSGVVGHRAHGFDVKTGSGVLGHKPPGLGMVGIDEDDDSPEKLLANKLGDGLWTKPGDEC